MLFCTSTRRASRAEKLNRIYRLLIDVTSFRPPANITQPKLARQVCRETILRLPLFDLRKILKRAKSDQLQKLIRRIVMHLSLFLPLAPDLD